MTGPSSRMRRGAIRAACSVVMIFSICSGLRAFGERPRGAAVDGVIVPQQATGQPMLGLTPEQLDRFFKGRLEFDRVFLEEDGLGPIFNDNSCGACHNTPLPGGSGTTTVTRFGANTKKGFDPLAQFGGSLLQVQAINEQCAEQIPPEATIIATRATPPTFGFGLVEAVADQDIQFNADNPPSPGVSGRVHMVETFENPGVPRVGRFGWKANVASMLSFSAGAALNEQGITNRFLTTENDPNGIRPPELVDCDTVDDPEDGPDEEGFDFIDRVADFQRFLAPPPQTPKSGMTGEAIFMNIGCGDCHVPAFATVDDPALEDAIRNQVIKPYSDFLLHNMGLQGDGIVQGQAAADELRTPLLWGMRFRDPMLHDASAEAGTFESRVQTAVTAHDAILAEPGARQSAQSFAALSEEDRAHLIAFLDSLGRREFDSDGDNILRLDDFADLIGCSQIDSVITPDDPCAVHDIDQNGIVDQRDFDSFLLAFGGEQDDCNCNGQADLGDIFNGTSSDANGDGVPDECENGKPPLCAALRTLIIKQGACPAPVNPHGNGVVPMVLVGEPDFAADTAVPASLQLRVCGDVDGPAITPLANHIKIKDLNHPFNGELECGGCACNDDQSSDGIDDLELKFRTSDVLALGIDAQDGVVTLELSGTLADGSAFAARDCLVIVPPGAGQTNLVFASNVGDTLVDVRPVDLHVDSDGFTNFARSYVPGTRVTVTAPLRSQGRRFIRWSVDGVQQPLGIRTIEVTVGQVARLNAFYERRARLVPDRPAESDHSMD